MTLLHIILIPVAIVAFTGTALVMYCIDEQERRLVRRRVIDQGFSSDDEFVDIQPHELEDIQVLP